MFGIIGFTFGRNGELRAIIVGVFDNAMEFITTIVFHADLKFIAKILFIA